MEAVVSDVVDPEDLLKFEKKYNNELVKGAVSKETKFEYAWCLIRSKYSEDIKKGIVLLEELVQKASKDDSRDFLFYLSVANYRLKEYERALKYIRTLLRNEPGNKQAQEMEKLIDKALKKGTLQPQLTLVTFKWVRKADACSSACRWPGWHGDVGGIGLGVAGLAGLIGWRGKGAAKS
uniref:Mitochondrial fission 1 protein n=1 Tax=Sphaeramia orbicularis TaxID=375764 RepID=A0A672ZIN5_9TELE